MTDRTFQLIAIGIYFATMLAIGYYATDKPPTSRTRCLAGASCARCRRGPREPQICPAGLMPPPGAIFVSGPLEQGVDRDRFGHGAIAPESSAPRLRTTPKLRTTPSPSRASSRTDQDTHVCCETAGVIILLFFTFYVSSMVAGGCLRVLVRLPT